MQTSALTPHGYLIAEPPQIQGTDAGNFFDGLMRGLTHKQNNYLSVIQGFSSLVLMDETLNAITRENLGHIKEAAQGAAGLAERILSAGSVRLSPQTVQLKDYIPLMADSFRAPFVKLHIPLEIKISRETPPVRVDSGRFRDVLLEILTNAAEATASGMDGDKVEAVSLKVLPPGQAPESRDGGVDVFIRNSGAAIPPEKLADVFKPFFSTRDSRHHGIGLTIAAVLASQMGIVLSVKSDADGTVFHLSIPAAEE